MTIKELEDYSPSHFYDMKSQLKDYVYNNVYTALDKGNAQRLKIKTKEDLWGWQSYIRTTFLESIGGLPHSDTSLNSKVTGTIKGEGFIVEKVIYESRPHNFVTANLYIPEGLIKPSGAVLFLCGHDSLAKHSIEYQSVCQRLVKSGLIVLSLDPIGQGERFSYYNNGKELINHGTTEHTHAAYQCLMTGYPSARYFLHDAIRGIDYLLSRKEVDPDNIGATGNSGGGTQTSMLMLCEDRIKAFAPGTFLTSYEENMLTGVPQDGEQNIPGFIKYGFDHLDILISQAPKPVAVLAASYDFFPIEGTRRTVASGKKYWEMFGESDKLYYVEDTTRHSYSMNLAEFAAKFFVKELNVTTFTNAYNTLAQDIKCFEPNDLWCTKTGQIREERKDTKFIFEENLNLMNQLRMDLDRLEENKKKKVAYLWLSEKVFNQRNQCAINRKNITEFTFEGLTINSYIWRSQERIINHCFAIKQKEYFDRETSPIIGIWDGGTSKLEVHMDWIHQQCQMGKSVFVLNASGVGAISPYQFGTRGINEMFGTIYKLTDDLIRLGDSMCALRIYDVIRAVDMLKEITQINSEKIHLYIDGYQGVYGLLAAFLDPRIQSVSSEEIISPYMDWVGNPYYEIEDTISIIIPKMLQYFDTDQVYLWLKEESRL